jgi:hypothetical protein
MDFVAMDESDLKALNKKLRTDAIVVILLLAVVATGLWMMFRVVDAKVNAIMAKVDTIEASVKLVTDANRRQAQGARTAAADAADETRGNDQPAEPGPPIPTAP